MWPLLLLLPCAMFSLCCHQVCCSAGTPHHQFLSGCVQVTLHVLWLSEGLCCCFIWFVCSQDKCWDGPAYPVQKRSGCVCFTPTIWITSLRNHHGCFFLQITQRQWSHRLLATECCCLFQFTSWNKFYKWQQFLRQKCWLAWKFSKGFCVWRKSWTKSFPRCLSVSVILEKFSWNLHLSLHWEQGLTWTTVYILQQKKRECTYKLWSAIGLDKTTDFLTLWRRLDAPLNL